MSLHTSFQNDNPNKNNINLELYSSRTFYPISCLLEINRINVSNTLKIKLESMKLRCIYMIENLRYTIISLNSYVVIVFDEKRGLYPLLVLVITPMCDNSVHGICKVF